MADTMPDGVNLISDTGSQDSFLGSMEDLMATMKTYTGMSKKEIKEHNKFVKEYQRKLKAQEKADERAQADVEKRLDAQFKYQKMRDGFEDSRMKTLSDKLDFSKVGEVFEKTSKDFVTAALGPLNLIVKPLEEGLGIDISEKIKTGLSGIFKTDGTPATEEKKMFDDTIMKDERVSPNAANLLTKGGVMGASAVYLGQTLGNAIEESAQDQADALDKMKGSFGLDDVASPRGISRMMKSILPGMLVAAPALIGVATAALLKREDISMGAEQIKSGEILRGLETILLGDRNAPESEAGKNIGKQGLAYGLGALGIGTSVGLGTAVTAGGGLAAMGAGGVAAAVGPALAAAFPPALIAAGVAATAKGIQVAWVNEWDTRSAEIVAETKAVLAGDEASWWDKVKAVAGLAGKGFFGSMVGGIKEMIDGFKERGANIKEALTGDMPLPKRILTLLKELNLIDAFIIGPAKDFFKGFGKTAGDYLKELLPEPLLNVLGNISDFFGWIYDKSIGKLKRAGSAFATEAWNNIKGFFGNVFDEVKDSFKDVFNRVIGGITGSEYYQKAVDLVDKVGAFFGDTVDNITGFVSDKFTEVKGMITSQPWFQTLTDGLDKVQNFFGDLFDTIFGWTKEKTDEAKLAVSNALARAEFEKEALALNAPRGEREKVMQLVEEQFGGDLKAFNEAFGASGMDAWNKGLGELFDGRTGEFNPDAIDKLIAAKPSTSVNDAIITKDGQVIQTAQDDNLIATKNEPRFLREEMSEISSPAMDDEEGTSILRDQLNALLNLAKILENKSFNNVIAAGAGDSGRDFDLIRGER